MITITYKDKTYKPSNTRPAMLWEEWMNGFIGSGALEEVKENKEDPYKTKITTCESHVAFTFPNKDHSILEKLREELEKRKQKMIEENWGPSYIEQVVWTLAVLDSLEQHKEEPEETEEAPCGHNRISTEGICRECGEKIPGHWAVEGYPKKDWTPTPGQEIEVDTGLGNWRKRVFHHYSDGFYYCEPAKEDNVKKNALCKKYLGWGYARQPQEDIELPEVPEWKAFTHDGQTYDSKDYQIEKLTEFCQAISPIVNQLIKANKK